MAWGKLGLPKGVTRHPSGFVARVGINREYKYLGLFRTAEEAGDAVSKAAKSLHGEFAKR